MSLLQKNAADVAVNAGSRLHTCLSNSQQKLQLSATPRQEKLRRANSDDPKAKLHSHTPIKYVGGLALIVSFSEPSTSLSDASRTTTAVNTSSVQNALRGDLRRQWKKRTAKTVNSVSASTAARAPERRRFTLAVREGCPGALRSDEI